MKNFLLSIHDENHEKIKELSKEELELISGGARAIHTTTSTGHSDGSTSKDADHGGDE